MDKVLEYFNGDELAASVWPNKYRLSSPDGSFAESTPDDMHRRLAKPFAKMEEENSILYSRLDTPKDLSEYGRTRPQLTEEIIYKLFSRFSHIVPQGSIMSQLGNPYSIGSLSNCFRGNVKVLTRDGWKEIKTLADKDVKIMTKGGGWVTAPFKSYGEQNLSKVLLTNGLRDKVIYATKDHRWAIFKKPKKDTIAEIKKTYELTKGDTLYSTYGKFRDFKPSPMGISHGIVFGDGRTVRGDDNANNITLCAESRVLGSYFPHCYVSSDENLCEGGSDHYGNIPNYYRELPNIRENKSYLYGWLAGYFAADGHLDERGAAMICSVDKSNIDFVMDVCGVLGIGCTETTSQTVISNLNGQEHTMFKCFLRKGHLTEDFFILDKHKINYEKETKAPNRWKVVSVKETRLIEEVFCAEVPETESFVIEGNILSMNCFVLGQPLDSYGGICKKDEEMVHLMKRRGGVGIDLSTLRPSTTRVSNAAKTSTGAASFMHRYSNSTREVAQAGRRGALMLSMDIRHPDVLEFITAKQDLSQVTGANISVMIRDEFMEAVKNDEDYILRFPCDFDNTAWMDGLTRENGIGFDDNEHPKIYNELIPLYDTVGDKAEYKIVCYAKRVKAKEYWDKIVECAWTSAEPGIMFIDRHWNYSPDGVYPQYRGVTTNPCSEIFMQTYDACRLIAKNLYSFVVNPFTKDAYIDFDLLYKLSYEQQWLGDLLVDLEIQHIDRILDKIASDPESMDVKSTEYSLWMNIREVASSGRRTGNGFTGLGDMLAALGLKYDSDEALHTIQSVCHTMMKGELDATIDLAILRGPFEGWDKNLEEVY